MSTTTESDRIFARYREREKEADELGRIITVRRLRPSEQTKVAAYCSDLTGYDEVTAPDGTLTKIPHRMPLLIAAAVCMIGDRHLSFPQSRRELDANFDLLDAEGLAAAGLAVARLAAKEGNQDPIDSAKN
jgi:hypothetical protein